MVFIRVRVVSIRVKVRLHDATKLMRYATCDKIALCKRAYLCDMRLLHAVAGKLKSSNFFATIACRMFTYVYIVRFLTHVFLASCKRAFTVLNGKQKYIIKYYGMIL